MDLKDLIISIKHFEKRIIPFEDYYLPWSENYIYGYDMKNLIDVESAIQTMYAQIEILLDSIDVELTMLEMENSEKHAFICKELLPELLDKIQQYKLEKNG